MVHWRVLVSGFMFVFCLVLISALSLPLSLFTICLHCVWSLLVIACHSYGSLCYVMTVHAALYLYCGVAVMFLVLGVVSVLGWAFFLCDRIRRGGGRDTFMAGGVSARHQKSC